MKLTDKELETAMRELGKRRPVISENGMLIDMNRVNAALKKIDKSRGLTDCKRCNGNGHVESGIAITGPESCGGGHAAFAPCPDCLGTGKGGRGE